ncbi:MAG: sugar ABC transporter substrate-binding protein [candidate division WOR-3 bacterium]|nr:sugar ABC transporter substrate-binding protein [candidate division WOR-3 bacterium]
MRYMVWFVILLAVLFGCKGKGKDEMELTVWVMGAEGEKIKDMIISFEKENSDISIKVQSIPWSDAHMKLLTSVIGGTTPDICQLGTTWVPEFASMDALACLDGYLKRSDVVKEENFFEGSWKANAIGNRVYGIPWYVDTRVLFYRRDILNEVGYDHPPTSWEELKSVCRALVKDVDQDGIPERYAINLPTSDAFIILMFVWQAGGDIFSSDFNAATFNNPKAREAFEFYCSFFDEGLAPIGGTADIDLFHAFKTGFLPMFISGPWMIELLHEQVPEIDGRWAVATLPKKETGISFIGGCNLSIFKNSKNKDAAWRFIEYMSEVENQIRWFELTGDLPAVKTAWDQGVLNVPIIATFGKQLEDARPSPPIPKWEEIRDKIEVYLEEVVYKKRSMDEALELLQREVEEILSRR